MEDSLDAIENANGDDKKTYEEACRNVGRQEETSSGLQQQTDTRSDRKIDPTPSPVNDSIFNNQRVFKKSLPNNKLILYLINRDLIVYNGKIDKLLGVIMVDPEYVENKRVYGQVTLTFRYGREDEEVMGLKFCTEAIVCFAQLYPPYPGSDHQEPSTALQEALIRRLGPTSHAFSMEIPAVAPPSVHLLPAKEYNGAPIGTCYDVKVYVAERTDEKVHRNSAIRMGIRVVQRTNPAPVPVSNLYSVSQPATIQSDCRPQRTRIMEGENEIVECDEPQPPHAIVEKPFLLNAGSIRLEVHLDRANYTHSDAIQVHVTINNDSHKSVKRIQILLLQHVDVCMFKSGKFKNVVGAEAERENCPLAPGTNFTKTYSVKPTMSSTKNWIALEDNYTKTGSSLASTVVCAGYNDKDRDPFAINVSYYVKVKLLVSLMGGVVSVKLPFTLMNRTSDSELCSFPSPLRNPSSPMVATSNENNVCKDETGYLAVMETSVQMDSGKVSTELAKRKMTDVDIIEKNEISEST
ncbi:arrestin homolog [Microplitis demolitor]|uniref:arrestin homolog n=1 Tax=Microplitis demolitor TaxID=69319 RepID=UPI0004CD2137|nr:arrestin homolog [Microplitis demolitor]